MRFIVTATSGKKYEHPNFIISVKPQRIKQLLSSYTKHYDYRKQELIDPPVGSALYELRIAGAIESLKKLPDICDIARTNDYLEWTYNERFVEIDLNTTDELVEFINYFRSEFKLKEIVVSCYEGEQPVLEIYDSYRE